MAETKKLTIKIKRLNNKTRKGLYTYIRLDGNKGRYYQYKQKEGELEATKKYYLDQVRKQKKSVMLGKNTLKNYKEIYEKTFTQKPIKQKTALTSQAKKYLTKVQKQPINRVLKAGIKHITINNALAANNNTIKRVNTTLLYTMVKDQEILDLISKEENMKKFKHRFETRIEIQDSTGKVLASATAFNMTPEESTRQVQKSIKEGTELKEGYDTNTRQKLEVRGYTNYTHYHAGKIHKVRTTYIIRKAK